MDKLLTLFPGTLFMQNVTTLSTIYTELESAIAAWQEQSGLACAYGCGLCCEKFEPEVQQVEADFCALYLTFRRPDLINRIYALSGAAHCVFYDPRNPGHCTVYPARPLLCRLFAFAALKDKQEQLAFRLCSHMQPDLQPRLYQGEKIIAAFRAAPPVMQDYSFRVNNLAAGCNNPPATLRMMILQSLQKIKLLTNLFGQTLKPDLDSGLIA